MPRAIPSLFCMLLSSAVAVSQTAMAQTPAPGSEELPVKYAIYSTAWSESSNAGLRIVARNQETYPIELISVAFRDENSGDETLVEMNLSVPAEAWGEIQLPYIELLFGNDCINKTLQDDWRLVEISNYTLNPSVRGLIIQDTDSFRIYQCVRSVYTTWADHEGTHRQAEWVLYHYERRPLDN